MESSLRHLRNIFEIIYGVSLGKRSAKMTKARKLIDLRFFSNRVNQPKKSKLLENLGHFSVYMKANCPERSVDFSEMDYSEGFKFTKI